MTENNEWGYIRLMHYWGEMIWLLAAGCWQLVPPITASCFLFSEILPKVLQAETYLSTSVL